jgi:two-component system nitrogen regulation sensor histidine kinase GlnL
LFEPFATTKADGRGLGLALAAKLMEELGGMIEHTSAPGRTVFTLRLPMAETEPRL